ncbi:MAG: hypothetical protein RIS47_2067 [Bacteroidota bacterium]|jgi:hypothetical protein
MRALKITHNTVAYTTSTSIFLKEIISGLCTVYVFVFFNRVYDPVKILKR